MKINNIAVLLILAVGIATLSGCGTIGGMAIGALATPHDPAKGALVGGIIGLGVDLIATQGYGRGYDVDCSRLGSLGEQAACERGRNDSLRQLQAERERGAYDMGRGGYYPTNSYSTYYPRQNYNSGRYRYYR